MVCHDHTYLNDRQGPPPESLMTSTILVRWRPKNYYSFASLVPVLQQTGLPLRVVKNNPSEELAATLTENDLVFFLDSFMSMDVPTVRQEMEENRSKTRAGDGQVVFVAGGSHPTAAPEHTLGLGFDMVARGEGEVVAKALVETVREGRDWLEIPGITYNDDGFVQHTPNPPRINLDEYQPYSTDPPIHPPIEVMRGCSFGCKFCQTPRVLRKVRYRSLEAIDKAVAYYAKRFASRARIDIRFIAPNILEYGSKDHRSPNLQALWALVRTVKTYPVRLFMGSFPSEVRPEFVTPETVEVLQQSDSKRVAVGAQSGSDSMLEKMRRGHTLANIHSCVDHLLDGGLTPQLDFILGNPDETNEEHWETLHLCQTLVDKGCRARLHYFMPLPGTPWGDARPSSLSAGVITEVGRLLQHKSVDGSFAQQIEIADELYQYR